MDPNGYSQSNPHSPSNHEETVHQLLVSPQATDTEPADLSGFRSDTQLHLLPTDGSITRDGTAPILQQTLEAHRRQKYKGLVHQHNKLLLIRTEVLNLYTTKDYEEQKLRDNIRFVTRHADSFLGGSETPALEGSGSYIVCDSSKLSALQRDIRQFERQSKHVTDLKRQLIGVESRLQSEQTKYALICADILKTLDPEALDHAEDVAVDWQLVGAESEEESVADIHPHLEQYFDKLGDQGIFEERLYELDAEHNHHRAIRIFEAEHDRPPQTPDTVFEALYNEERTILQSKFDQGKQEADHLREICRNEGLLSDLVDQALSERDLLHDAMRNFDGLENSTTDSTSELVQPLPSRGIPLTSWISINEAEGTFEGGLRRTETIDSKSRIANWTQNIDDEPSIDDYPVSNRSPSHDETSTPVASSLVNNMFDEADRPPAMKRRKTYPGVAGMNDQRCRTPKFLCVSPSRSPEEHRYQGSIESRPTRYYNWSSTIDDNYNKLKLSFKQICEYFINRQ
ncbi:hypothetical protein K431DRAFT_309497 [Polychaeton citri CBS 116435]|uniref:Uncharacterized protein n=1 Tax=Polychaeton citri CBS 116435 TaxID=1314669 RepID=A0A9P4UU20_9PEZI|nr:hypothetical protein K431DRAFT_309497 [Polychaeton citri CBS 116435]